MSNQEIFEMLSENECTLFYAYSANKDNERLKVAYETAKEALVAFAKETGCANN